MSDVRPSRLGGVVGSLRFRIVAITTVAVFAVLAGSGVILVFMHRDALTDNLDEAMRLRADALAALVESGRVPVELVGGADDDAIAQIIDAAGDVVAASPTIAGLAPLVEGGSRADSGQIRRVRFPEVDDSAFRLLTLLVPTSDGDAVIHVAEAVDDIDYSSAALATSLGLVVPGAALVLGLIIWWGVGRALLPVEAIRAEIADIGGSDLHRRVPEPATRDEIGRLARTMNAMLGRVEEATQRQQHFVADASHELRSPLTQIRSELEVDLAHPEQADLVATHKSVLDSASTMQRLVEDLLHLARSDAGVGRSRNEAVDLDDIVAQLVRRHRGGQVDLDTAAVSSGQVRGDPDQLSRAIGNLIDNAVRHATGVVAVGLAEDRDQVTLTITDDGPGIQPDQRERVFERFVRLDDSRTRGTGGTGLGLAIAREVVHSHGGTIVIAEHDGPGAQIVVTLPANPASPPGGPVR